MSSSFTAKRVGCAVGALVLAGLLAPACLRPTQATLEIKTDLPCGETKGVAIIAADKAMVAEERAGFPSTLTSTCKDGSIGTLVVTPGEDGAGEAAVIITVGIRVSGEDCKPPLYLGCIVARRRFVFVDHTPLTLPIDLKRDCIDVPCGVDSTCSKGVCVSSFVSCAASGCALLDENPVPVDGSADGTSPMSDAQAADGSSDGSPLGDGSTNTEAGDGGDGGACNIEGNAWSYMSCRYWNGTSYDTSCGVIWTIPRCGNQDPYGGKCSDLVPDPVQGASTCSQDRCSTTWRCMNRYCAYGCVPGGGAPDFNWHPQYACTTIAGCE